MKRTLNAFVLKHIHAFDNASGMMDVVSRRDGWQVAPVRVISMIALMLLVSGGKVSLVAGQEATVQLLPREVTLATSGLAQRIVVERYVGGIATEDVTARCFVTDAAWRLESSDPAVVRVEQGELVPVAVGSAELRLSSPMGADSIAIHVTADPTQPHWEFRRHVLPVLARSGCNMGACHGALAGKGGFKLSLRGYYPAGDFQNITREARGRRIELADPAASLLLTKPSGQVPHKGGLRLPADSADYRLVAQWIQAGAPGPTDADPQLVSLEVSPDVARLAHGASQQLLVTARYSDGRIEDVTRWAKFSSSNETVAQVDDQGRVHVDGFGEGAVVVWFSSRIVLARIVSPFDQDISTETWKTLTATNLIDHHVNAKLQQLNIVPSPRCSDEVFVRRVYLDTTGRLPEPDAVSRFVADPRHDKRSLLIDDLLSQESYVDYWTYRWSDMLLVNGRRLRPEPVKAYYSWIRGHVERNTPWDQMVREIVTAKGSSTVNGATNFYALHQDPESMSENICQAFLGLSIGCAKCHNHPLEKWTNDEYYAMANFFSRVQAKGWGGDPRSGDGERSLIVASQGELLQPLRGRAQPPKPLDGEVLPDNVTSDRREYLADWLVSPTNPYFSRAVVNRIWAAFLGRGIVNPVDDLRMSNPASNEPLLAALADELVDHQFDLKHLMRMILNSETYQRSSESMPGNEADETNFSRYYVRRLTAEVLLDAIAQVTQVPSEFVEIGYDGSDLQKTDAYPIGTRATELFDSAVVSGFLDTFGRNARDITCECERSNTPNVVQVLHLNNGTTINERLAKSTSYVTQAMQLAPNWTAVIDDAFRRTLARNPTEQETSRLLAELVSSSSPEWRTGIEDLYWSLMTSREFLFNH